MDNEFLIPANTKRGHLILSLFTLFDLILFGSGVFISIILLLIVETTSLIGVIIVLLPGLICSFLVLPIPNYHNVITFVNSMFSFLMNQRIYKWKGWCFYESTNEKN